MKTKNVLLAFAIVGLVGFTSCKEEQKEVETVTKEVAQKVEEVQDIPNIVGVAAGNENFSTLVAAVKAADLVDTLSSEGPFTVFAPTNDAFGALPEGTVPTLLEAENKGKLTSILTYHVVSGNFDAASVIQAVKDNNGTFVVKTVQGEELSIMVVDGKVMLQDANGNKSTVVIADVKASNGTIHAIDSVVMPKS
ncbi:MAG: fasciclin domain-containing protein [Lacinutrix sp.]|uniref:fasciclin domain-containing protein n=1 Tax=Lacinutrix sp. TaxID=1937692 RepID=UPI0030A8DDCC